MSRTDKILFIIIFLAAISAGTIIYWKYGSRFLQGVSGPIENGTITLADNNRNVRLRVGETFLLKLGEQYNWDISIGDNSVIDRVKNIAVVRGAQGVYKANKAGKTALTAVGDPVCRQSVPPCGISSILFKLEITVAR